MALKYEVSTLEELDVTLHDLYAMSADGLKYKLDVDGAMSLGDFNTVYGALQKERNDSKAIKDKLKLFGELDPDLIHSQLARIPELEAAAKGSLDEAKIEEILKARTEAEKRPILAEKDALAKRLAETEVKLKELDSINRQRKLNDELTTKIDAAKIDPLFKETVMLKAEKVLFENDEGTYLTKDGIFGVTGYVPIETWLSELQVTAPHFWGNSIGGGAKGSGAAMYQGNNPFVGGVKGNVTEQMRLERKQPAVAAQLKKAADARK